MKSVVRFFVGASVVLSGSVATAAATTYVWSKTPLGATVAEGREIVDWCEDQADRLTQKPNLHFQTTMGIETRERTVNRCL